MTETLLKQLIGAQQSNRSRAAEPPAQNPQMFKTIGSVVKNVQAPEWLIKGIVETDSLTVIHGNPGEGKSFLVMDLSACVATGTDWHSRRVKKGAVFYIAGEGQSGIARRFKGWELHNSVELTDASLAICTIPVTLDDAATADRVRDSIEAMAREFNESPVLIVVDTLARTFGGDENSTRDMGRFIRVMDEIRQQWKATVIIVHHTGKDASRGARGSSSLKAAVDTEYNVTMDDTKTIVFKPLKMKEGELASPMAFSLTPVELSITDEDDERVSSCALALMAEGYRPPQRAPKGRGKNQAMALEALVELHQIKRNLLDEGDDDSSTCDVRIEEWCIASIKRGLTRNRFNEVKASLAKKGTVRLTSEFVTLEHSGAK